MSYSSFQGYNGNYGPPSQNQSSAYGTSRSSSAAVAASTDPAYPASSSQLHYGSAAYAWPDRNQSSYGNMNGNAQNYGTTGWKDGQGQQPVYDHQRPQPTYVASSTTNNTSQGWYGATTRPQAQPSTHALSNLAYASGLDSQEHNQRDDRRTLQSHPGPQHFGSAQREGYGQERVASPSYGRGYVSSNARTTQNSQAEQSPTASHESLAVSAAAALEGAVNRRYASSPAQPNAPTQQYQHPASSVAKPGNLTSAKTTPTTQNQQPAAPFLGNNARGQHLAQSQALSSASSQKSPNLKRYETNETHRYAHSYGPNVTLPPPSSTQNVQPKPTHSAGHNNAGAALSSGKPENDNTGITASNSTDPPNDTPRQPNHEPATSMPTFIDPSQVFNPYHKEHERQKREEAERAKRASMEKSEPSTDTRVKDPSTNPPSIAVSTTSLPETMQQAPKSASADTVVRPSSSSSSVTAEPKESGDVDMANEMKAMMHRMREWKTKDPSLFQKLWDDMKKGGSTAQPTKGQTPTKSPQLIQVVPQQSDRSQSSQPLQLPTSPASQKRSHDRPGSSRNFSKASSIPKRHWDQTMLVENNEEGLPDLGRFPAERRNRRTNNDMAEAKARREAEAKPSTVTAPRYPSQQAAQTKGDERLTWQPQPTLQQPSTTNTMPQAVPTQVSHLSSPNGGTIWPEAKRKALAEAAQKALIGLTANKDKSITAAEIHALLEQNPSYLELCEKLEAQGFAFHRGQFARFLLNSVPDLSSASHPPNKKSQQQAPSIPMLAQPPQPGTPNVSTVPVPSANGPIQHSHPPSHLSGYMNYRLPSAPQPGSQIKATPIRPAKPRLGVSSPNIPAPIPGSKEAKARKRDFSELVDLTQLSDDDDYVMPRKQARYEPSPERETLQIKSDIPLAFAGHKVPNMQRQSYGSSPRTAAGAPEGAGPLRFDPQAQALVSQLQSQVSAQASQAIPPKSRHLLAKPLNKAEALRKSYYDPKTVARDILIAAGRHPAEHPLNAHLAGLLGKHIDVDSDLSTFDWDTVDPGGPPMPVVQVVDIPAGPPRWRLGQRMRPKSPLMGTFQPPPKVRKEERVRVLEPNTPARDQAPADTVVHKEQVNDVAGKGRVPSLSSSLARLSSQTKSLLEGSLKTQTPDHQPTQLRQIQSEPIVQHSPKAQISGHQSTQPRQTHNTVVESKTPQRTLSHTASTPHHPQSTTPIISNSPSSQQSQTRRRGRPRKSSIMDGPPPAPPPPKRRGRPPGSRSKGPSAYMLKKAAKNSGIQVSAPASTRSPSPLQYSIYACQWRRCDAKLHNLATLRKHIVKVHKVSDEETRGEGQPCWWKKCRTLEVKNEEVVPQVTFHSTSDWLDHIESDHLHPLGMKLGDGPSSAQTGKPREPFSVSKYLFKPLTTRISISSSSKARTSSHTDPQTLARDRQTYLSDTQGRAVTAPSTKISIQNYPPDTLTLSSVTMNPESNIPNRAFSKAHGNEKMEIRQSAIETLVALQRHKERVGPGLDRGGCTLVNEDRRRTLMDSEGMARVVDADY